MRSSASPSRARLLPALLAILVALSLACGDDAPVTSVDRETFVATYVELRRAALESPNGKVSPERKQQILAARGVTEEDLVAFAEAWGRDVDAMAAIWTDVEQRLQGNAAPDSMP